jgi:hypothetical protein
MSYHTRVDATSPEAAGVCDLCGIWYPLRELRQQQEWAGEHVFQFNSLRCEKCWDVPFELNRTILLPPDPPPVFNVRVPNFAYEEQTVLIAQWGGPNEPPWGAGPELILCDQTGEIPLLMQYLTSDGGVTGGGTVLTTESGVILTTDTGIPLTP